MPGCPPCCSGCSWCGTNVVRVQNNGGAIDTALGIYFPSLVPGTNITPYWRHNADGVRYDYGWMEYVDADTAYGHVEWAIDISTSWNDVWCAAAYYESTTWANRLTNGLFKPTYYWGKLSDPGTGRPNYCLWYEPTHTKGLVKSRCGGLCWSDCIHFLDGRVNDDGYGVARDFTLTRPVLDNREKNYGTISYYDHTFEEDRTQDCWLWDATDSHVTAILRAYPASSFRLNGYPIFRGSDAIDGYKLGVIWRLRSGVSTKGQWGLARWYENPSNYTDDLFFLASNEATFEANLKYVYNETQGLWYDAATRTLLSPQLIHDCCEVSCLGILKDEYSPLTMKVTIGGITHTRLCSEYDPPGSGKVNDYCDRLNGTFDLTHWSQLTPTCGESMSGHCSWGNDSWELFPYEEGMFESYSCAWSRMTLAVTKVSEYVELTDTPCPGQTATSYRYSVAVTLTLYYWKDGFERSIVFYKLFEGQSQIDLSQTITGFTAMGDSDVTCGGCWETTVSVSIAPG